jgi:hypothetical protein
VGESSKVLPLIVEKIFTYLVVHFSKPLVHMG